MNAMAEFVALLLVGGLCAALLALAEALRRLLGIAAESTRKLVHVSTGLVALAFPWIFASPGSVALLCCVFVGLLGWSQHRGWLGSVHAVARRSAGAAYFPLAVALVFLLTRGRREVYVASILVLALSDALAAVVGGAYGRHRYRVQGGVKSLEGSLAFLLSAILCVHLTLRLMTPLGGAVCAARAVCAAVFGVLLEAASAEGSDNLTVPLGVCLVLSGGAAGLAAWSLVGLVIATGVGGGPLAGRLRPRWS